MEQERYRLWAAEEDAFNSRRKDVIREDLARRLKNICANFPEDDFRALIDEMAERKLKGERKGSA